MQFSSRRMNCRVFHDVTFDDLHWPAQGRLCPCRQDELEKSRLGRHQHALQAKKPCGDPSQLPNSKPTHMQISGCLPHIHVQLLTASRSE
jgi:hypothetical protein